jgi:hypothetical protein
MEISILTPLTGFVDSHKEPSQGLAGGRERSFKLKKFHNGAQV